MKIQFYLCTILLTLGISLCLTASSSEDNLDSAQVWLKHTRRCLKKVFSLQADFNQDTQYRLSHHGKNEKSRGTLKVRRGGRYRLTYSVPHKRILISDGVTVWSYDKATKTAYTVPAGNTALDQVLPLLIGDESSQPVMNARFVGGAKKPEEGVGVTELIPTTPHKLIASIVLTLASECPCFRRIMIVDHAGSAIRLTFENIKTNVGLGKRLFTFTPPKGARIVNP